MYPKVEYFNYFHLKKNYLTIKYVNICKLQLNMTIFKLNKNFQLNYIK